MRTRRGNSYPVVGAPTPTSRKRVTLVTDLFNFFDNLPDDIVLFILQKLASTAECSADFIASLATSKRFNGLGLNSMVLSKALAETFAVKAINWSPSFNRFLHRCSDVGNIEANYTLGMIQFYCFQNWGYGASLMAKAAIRSHASALYSLAIIQFNGSGVFQHKKDRSAGVTLCTRAVNLGHIDAIRELGHCLKDGYGTTRNVTEGQRFLLEANAREIDAICETQSTFVSNYLYSLTPLTSPAVRLTGSPMMYDNYPKPVPHPANRFLTGWYANRIPKPELNICSYAGCGRPETRMHEFRRCSICSVMNYCSRGCQARDWTMGHFKMCKPAVRFPNVINAGRR